MTEPGHHYYATQLSHNSHSSVPLYFDEGGSLRIRRDQPSNRSSSSRPPVEERDPQTLPTILTESQSSNSNHNHGDQIIDNEIVKNSLSSATERYEKIEGNSSEPSSEDIHHGIEQEEVNEATDSKFDTEQADAISDRDADEYLYMLDIIPPYSINRQPGLIKNRLCSGSRFTGFQRNKKESYEVKVKVQHIDHDNSYLCGYLSIKDLTQSHPLLTTFFEGEIISRQHPFLTKKWEATEEIDRAHWSKLDGFEKYLHTFNEDCFDYDDLNKSDYIYMRWKERFFVPDHTIKHVEGTSYAGFYYVCYSKKTSQITGYYFQIIEYVEGR